ncbi:ribonuclease VapC [uncultured Methanobrevibacter sp.]|uniref:ribonuclease VapC n=1 Tax=uncultured Methanobrevibacter sp. TaxID=253161 RepID=UPI0025D6F771|nr:ribonuclease VapC [uncultured Methanobrevibacter sp.]
MDNVYKILDASAFIGGYRPKDNLNFTVPEITYEVKDLKSKILLDEIISEGNLIIKSPDDYYINKLNTVIKNSGDDLRLSYPDRQLLALALEINEEYKNILFLTDDYSIQNVLKLLNIPYKSILTDGIKGVYNWVKTCNGCKKEYPSDYEDELCEICGSKIFKRRIKN